MAFLPEWQVEYIRFIHGLAFVILATVCFSVSRSAKKQLPWTWLGLFGVMHGLGKWVLCLTSDINASNFFSIIVTIMVAVSFLCLAVFGRFSIVKITGKGPGAWIYIPLLFLAVLAIAGPGTAQASLLHLLGLIGGLLAARALFLVAGNTMTPAGRWLKNGSLTLLIYSLFVGLSILPAPLLSALPGGDISLKPVLSVLKNNNEHSEANRPKDGFEKSDRDK